MEVIERVTPGVVHIITPDGTGSGFIISENGLAVTNEHVVGSHKRVIVRIQGGSYSSYDARVLGVDAVADLAVLDIIGGIGLTVVDMGDSDDVSIGEDVVAVGYPISRRLGGSPTITRGIVSSVRATSAGVEHIQTDAAINPGNSGGPLFNGEGEVIGVNTFVIRDIGWAGGDMQGINLAVSINEVKDRIPSLSAGVNTGVTPTPSPTATPAPKPRVSSGRFYIEDAEMPHKDDGKIKTITAFTDVRDFNIDAHFGVPYSSSVGDWSVGFVFRQESVDDFSYAFVTNDGRYLHYERRNGESVKIAEGDAAEWAEWRTSVGEENSVNLIAVESRGWLFVNYILVAELDLSGSSERGGLKAATGFFSGHEVIGRSTEVSYLLADAVEKLHGPSSGSLTKDSGNIATRRANVNVEFAYARADFRTPDDNEKWSAGLMIRKSEQEDYFLFAITSAGCWRVWLATFSGEDWQTLEEGCSSEIDISDPTLNRIEVFHIGGVASMYVNGERLTYANIRAESVPVFGDVRIAYGIFRNDHHSVGRYDNFAVYGARSN